MATEPTIVTGTGIAAGAGSTGNGPTPAIHDPTLGNPSEQAMAQAIRDVQNESEAVAGDAALDPKAKAAKIADLNRPENIRARMLRARDIQTGKIKA